MLLLLRSLVQPNEKTLGNASVTEGKAEQNVSGLNQLPGIGSLEGAWFLYK